MRVLVVGSGGREHALLWKIRRSPMVKELYCAPGNAGAADLADCVPIEAEDVSELADFAEKLRVDLTVVGPELPLSLGIVDEFARRGLRILGPGREAAKLESSKVFAKEFMARHGIPTAPFKVFRTAGDATRHVEDRATRFPLVVKADGLAGGKGVVIAKSREEAAAAISMIMEDRAFGSSGDALVVEDCLEGTEVSFFALCDGTRLAPWPTSQDYKRAFDGDRGPNTGGMGCYSPSPFVDDGLFAEIVASVMNPAVAGLAREGHPYRGFLYAGLMLTPQGPKVLEFNCRLGDPEAEALLPRLQSDLVPFMAAAAEGALPTHRPLEWKRGPSVTVIAASEGYPGSYAKGRAITGLAEAASVEGVVVFHSGTRKSVTGEIETAGGRVLAVTATRPTLQGSVSAAYEAVGRIHFQGMRFRKDIAARAVEMLARAEGGNT
ncbi:MAG TPA: phosphoribosylamine--glycine ligase [Candidatus Saccharimonadales bacterium]|nr:phosphoribosylamine--glycine ligase [Candidatus Saccharimonadales bacterium]